MKNWTRVFAFTLKNEGCSKSYRIATAIVTILLLVAIPVVMVMADGIDSKKTVAPSIGQAVCVNTVDLSALNMDSAGIYKDIKYESAPSIEEAQAACGENGVIVYVNENEINVLYTDDSKISSSAAQAYSEFLTAYYPYIVSENPAEIAVPAYAASAFAETDVDDLSEMTEIFGFIVTYATLMLLYFLILIYGQGVANSAIAEKTSKLMDLFLVSIKPGAMMLGKTLAMALSGIIQVCLWVFGAIGGVAIGVHVVKIINPDTTLGIISFLDSLSLISGIVTPGGILLTIGIIIAGFILYCSLSGCGGAMAGKPEDLSSTNMFFALILVASFFLCMYSGGTGMISDKVWLAYIPFTAILIVPGRIICGTMTLVEGLASLGITLAFALLLNIVAGKIYEMMAFYRGNPPTPAKMIKLLRKKSLEPNK